MLQKAALITLLSALAITTTTTTFAQRDFRKERAQLDREERAEKRRLKSEREIRARIDYGANMLCISPVTIMDIGVGFGLSYERIFGPDGSIGVVLPVHLILKNEGDDFFTGNNDFTNTQVFVYFTPGLKIYPFGQRRVTYAIGPSLMLGYGGGDQSHYNNTFAYYDVASMRRLRVGLLVNNYVNFQFTPAFSLGMELGAGIRYIDRERIEAPVYDNQGNLTSQKSTTTYDHGISATGQFSVTLGYRF